ncbi:hypothetical protein [Pyxidicoccus xibeiensis]|uniref:hypothetical protein n=1 Tax=Pyxidicoccus xibeiensis TaxID=2906759 RepID=UPI0020A7279F|nr:hypothetical protein [Pyxidicoccus xibeiensis]MCP3142639.1 hypothetical protein [Pyxidicoccus xibeiensis]
MSHPNPLWLGAACVVLGTLLLMAPSCWFKEGRPPPPAPESSRPAPVFVGVGWGLLSLWVEAR